MSEGEVVSIDRDVIVHAPRFWGDRLLAMCLWDAWTDARVPERQIVDYTQAAIPRARRAGMTLYHWIVSVGGAWRDER